MLVSLKEASIQSLKVLKSMDPFRHILQSYRGPFSTTRHILKNYQPKTKIEFDRGNYTVKTICSGQELEEVLKLRYNIFYREFQNKKFPFGLDLDAFDHVADHLVIIDKRESKIVGTYRLISSLYSHMFYSQSEFELKEFLKTPAVKLELSRACIQKDYRTGIVMNLLWRGIAQYLNETGSQFLFGCASVRTMDIHQTACVYKHLVELGVHSDQFRIRPIGSYEMTGLAAAVEDLTYEESVKETAQQLLPPLFQSYLKMGAHAYGFPALDTDFRCVDFLTILHVEKLQRLYERKYMS